MSHERMISVSGTIPHDLDAERAVLGAMLQSPFAIDAVIDGLLSQDFYRPANGIIFMAIVKLRKSGSPTDPIAVNDAIAASGSMDSIGGPATIIDLLAEAPSVGGVTH